MTTFIVADFETTTNPEHTEVWLSCFVEVTSYNNFEAYKIDYNIKDFLKNLYLYINNNHYNTNENDYIVFFHNLKFDGSFLLNFFLKNNIECDYFINDMGIWYSITLEFENYKITFRDSLKILNFSIKQMAGLFKMEMAKGTTPLLENKPLEIKTEWLEYVKTDVAILAKAIFEMYYSENFTKYTSASEALTEFKRIFEENGNRFRNKFPILSKEIDTFCRNAYRGGWTYVNPKIQGKLLNNFIEIYDINSMYPSTMIQHPLPVGTPEHIKGYTEPKQDHYYIYKVRTAFEIKPNHVATIQVKNQFYLKMLNKKGSDYLTTTNGEVIELYLTNFDYDIFNKHYNHHTEFIETLEFKTERNLFTTYINTYKYKKENAKTPAEKQKAKIMLNSLYGKFGAKIISRQKNATLEDDVLKFTLKEEEEVTPIYVPVALFVTSISRHFIISNAQENFKNFLYADTDSLHLLKSDNLKLDIDPNEFGKWAFEGLANKGKYLRAKLYAENLVHSDGSEHLDIKGAGMTDEIKSQINFDNFEIGQEFTGKRSSKQIKGGVHIYETTFKIKENDYL